MGLKNFLVGLLICAFTTVAAAQDINVGPSMAPNFSNAQPPGSPGELFGNTANGFSAYPTYEVSPGGLDLQTALTAATNAGGGTVHVYAGSYPRLQAMVIGSNTKLVCDQGVTISATNVGWTGTEALLINQNNSASVITDHDIVVEGCGWLANGTFATDGGFHHISFRMAQHIRIEDKNSFTAAVMARLCKPPTIP